MATVICPKCGTENSGNAMNCKQCRINLEFALAQKFGEKQKPITIEPEQDTRKKIVEFCIQFIAGFFGWYIFPRLALDSSKSDSVYVGTTLMCTVFPIMIIVFFIALGWIIAYNTRANRASKNLTGIPIGIITSIIIYIIELSVRGDL